MARGAKQTLLKPYTLKAFEAYVRKAEVEMDQTHLESSSFLWSDASSERARQIHKGQIVAQFWSGEEPVKVQDGLIHDWIGAAFLPATNLKKTLALIQDYDNHKNIYKPEVMDSKLISHHDNDFQIYLRLLKKRLSP